MLKLTSKKYESVIKGGFIMSNKTKRIISVILLIPIVFFVTIWFRALENPERDPFLLGSNIIYVGYIITLLGIPIPFLFSIKSQRKQNLKYGVLRYHYSLHHLFTRLDLALHLMGGDGFIAIGAWMVYFPIMFLIGLIILIIGFVKKEKAK